MADAMMEFLGEANGVKWYWAEPGRFEKPGVYYWNGSNNVLCVPYRAAPGAPAVAQVPEPYGYVSEDGVLSTEKNSSTFSWLLAAHRSGQKVKWPDGVTLLYAVPEAPAHAAQSAGEMERGDVVAFEFYNRATGHAIVDYSVNTHVGNLSADKGYEARPLVYAEKREEVTDGSKPIPLWQAREALDELEAAARGDAPFNHQAAAVVRAALSHKEPQR